MAYWSGDFHRRAGSACNAARPDWIVQAAWRSAIRHEELARLYTDRKLCDYFDCSYVCLMAH